MEKETVKVCIFGGRDFDDYSVLRDNCDKILEKISKVYNIKIVSGRARGADTLGEGYAKEKGYEIDYYPAEWNKYGKRAGMLRNDTMARVGHIFIGFWDGVSPGTRGMISLVERYGKPLRVIRY